MKPLIFILLLLCSAVSFAQKKTRLTLRKGDWAAQLQLNNSDVLPFQMEIRKSEGAFTLNVKNGAEIITLDDLVFEGDSVRVRFPFFHSELIFTSLSKKSLEGYWVNYNKGDNYTIPLLAKKERNSTRFMVKEVDNPMDVNGRWAVTFEPNTDGAYPAIGIFDQERNSSNVSGTFLTETGDYRFLEGTATDDSLFLSCFDGAHAFLFTAAKQNDSLHGRFLSGKHWQSEWIAVKNDEAQLTSPDELTYVVEDRPVKFALKDLNGQDFNFPSETYQNKVVIIQIMGTWCPNCLDETMYYKQLFEHYHDRGLEVISIGYEAAEEFEQQAASIQRLREKLELDFTFVVGGQANKGLASEHFSMLNRIISFPTSIFIGRDGKVKRVHTGFNGPGTGSHYQEYVENTNSLIESLLTD